VPSPKYTHIRKVPRVLVYSRTVSIHGVVGERLLVVLLRIFGSQASDLISATTTKRRSVHVSDDNTTRGQVGTDHRFYAFVVENIVGIPIVNENPHISIYNILQQLFTRPHPIPRLRKMIIDIIVRDFPFNLSSDLISDAIKVVSDIRRVRIWVLRQNIVDLK